MAKARARAALRIASGAKQACELPDIDEIEAQLQCLSRSGEPLRRRSGIRDIQVAALRVMRLLAEFSPRLVGDPAFGFIYRGREARIELVAQAWEQVQYVLAAARIGYLQQKSRPGEAAFGEYATVNVSLVGPVSICLRVRIRQSPDEDGCSQASPIGLGLDELESLLENEGELEENSSRLCPRAEVPRSRSARLRQLLDPLETIFQDSRTHPEGDVLYHSLQVFELACGGYPYDEDFLLAALVHDVGKAIDPRDAVQAGLQAIRDCTSERTQWFVENLPLAKKCLNGTAGRRLRARLQAHPDYEQLIELARIDREGRQIGMSVRDLDAVLASLERLAEENG